jgi:hypothetical protein
MDGGMLRQWAAVEHNRLHCAEEWPDGPYKQAVIAAIHATLESLFENSGTSTGLSEGMAGAGGKKDSEIHELSWHPRSGSRTVPLAA